MRLLVYSYFPVLQDHHAGGAQMIMHDLLLGLAQSGISVTVICPKSDSGSYLNVKNVQILPVLCEPEDRELRLNEKLRNLQRIAAAADAADVIWTLDRHFPLEVSQPIVLTLATIAYEMEIDSLLGFNWDVLVVPSSYLWDIATMIAGADVWEGEARPIRLIPNGINTAFFSPQDPAPLATSMGLPDSERYLLFPHRPEPGKGFDVALGVLHQLLARNEDYKLLIPTNPLSMKSMRHYETEYINALRFRVAEMGLATSVVFHDWIPRIDLPSYFSLGEWCLAIGSLPEGFGLTPVQSISCGTPVVSTRAGALKGQFPAQHGVTYVDFGAVDQIVSCVLSASPKSELKQGQAYVREHYSLEKCVDKYLDCITSARKNHARYRPSIAQSSIRLSPWCRLRGDATIWHDLKMTEIQLTMRELEVIERVNKGAALADLIKEYRLDLTNLLSQGILIGSSGQVSSVV